MQTPHADHAEFATAVQPASAPDATAAGRADTYVGIHKALRLFMTRTLTTVGATDPGDAAEVEAALAMVQRLMTLCELHLKHENTHVHPALERAIPGSAARIAGEHEHHVEAIADLRDLAGLVADSHPARRPAALARLYRAMALFVADNLQHMHVEETAHNAVLWAHYTDAQLMDIEHAIVASIEPAAMFEALHWFLPALSTPERVAMLGGMRQGMPPEAFVGVLDIARRTLDTGSHAKLMRALQLPVAPGLMTC